MSFPVGDGRAHRLTISMGAASSDRRETEVDDILAKADAALHAAKRAGRNARCRLARPT